MRRGVILDRDGTLIDVVRDADLGIVTTAFHPDQIRFLPGVIDGLRALSGAGFLLAVATNQPGAAKGQFPLEAIERTNAALVELLSAAGVKLAAFETCLHHPEGGPGGDPALGRRCGCRKPAAGMLTRITADLGLDPACSWMVGDSEGDLAAARAAGLRAGLLFDPRRCELCPVRGGPAGLAPDAWAPRLDALAALLVRG